MTVQTFTYTPEPFRAVQWTGGNLDEIAAFTGQKVVALGGVLAVQLADGPIATPTGWWVSIDHLGDVCVSSGLVRRDKWIPVP